MKSEILRSAAPLPRKGREAGAEGREAVRAEAIQEAARAEAASDGEENPAAGIWNRISRRRRRNLRHSALGWTSRC